jgi:hypothetical protein
MALSARLATKPSIAIPAPALRRVQMVSYREDAPATIIGSYSFRAQRYPADIDTMDSVGEVQVHGEWTPATESDTRELLREFTRRLQAIVQHVAGARNTFYLEVKAGIDEFALGMLRPIGDMHDGIFTPSTDLWAKILLAKGRGWISAEAATRMLVALSQRATLGAREYDLLSSELRKAFIMRWAPDEIAAGVKKRGPGEGMPLETAVYNPAGAPSLVKIDVITKVSGAFLELSNIFVLREVRADGSFKYLSTHPGVEDITFDVEKMLFSPAAYNPYKAIKRMFVYARLRYLAGDERLAGFLEAALDYLSGDDAIYYQLKSDLETLVKLLTEFPSAIDSTAHDPEGPPVYYAMAAQLQGMSGRLAATSMPEEDVVRLSRTIDEAIHAPHAEAAHMLEGVEKVLKGIVKDSAINWLGSHGLAPPSAALDPFLPKLEYAEILNAKGSPLDPLLATQHSDTYSRATSASPVAAGGFNVMRGGSQLGSCPEGDARAMLARRILAQ